MRAHDWREGFTRLTDCTRCGAWRSRCSQSGVRHWMEYRTADGPWTQGRPPPCAASGAIPALERHCGSWVAVRDGAAIAETFEFRNAEKLAALPGVEVLTAAQWLGRFNASVRA